MNALTAKKLTGSEIRKGMFIDGREITARRDGAGSAKVWTYLTFADGGQRRVRRNTVRLEVEVPVLAPTTTLWTLAYRKPRANRFQRVTNWAGTWAQARELANAFAAAHPDLQVYYVPSVGSDPEHKVLVASGRYVRVTETGSLPADLLAQVPDAGEAQARWEDGAY